MTCIAFELITRILNFTIVMNALVVTSGDLWIRTICNHVVGVDHLLDVNGLLLIAFLQFFQVGCGGCMAGDTVLRFVTNGAV